MLSCELSKNGVHVIVSQWCTVRSPNSGHLVYLLVIPECLFQEALSLQGLLVDQAVLFLPKKITRLSVKTGLKMQTGLLSCIYRNSNNFLYLWSSWTWVSGNTSGTLGGKKNQQKQNNNTARKQENTNYVLKWKRPGEFYCQN